uniref:Uncharacterized protein n=1 Tax=Cacopsylla melanoneura TaxID=428564 RepID=A0A8D9BGR8_9HEMI
MSFERSLMPTACFLGRAVLRVGTGIVETAVDGFTTVRTRIQEENEIQSLMDRIDSLAHNGELTTDKIDAFKQYIIQRGLVKKLGQQSNKSIQREYNQFKNRNSVSDVKKSKPIQPTLKNSRTGKTNSKPTKPTCYGPKRTNI